MTDLNTTDLAREEYCYVTSTGRVTGRPHRIEIWFGMNQATIYLLNDNGRADWVKNMRVQPNVTVEIGKRTFAAQARLVSDPEEDALARRLLLEKYQRGGDSLVEWSQTALPMAIDLQSESAA